MLLLVFSLMALLIGMSGAAEAQENPSGAEIEILEVDAEFPPQVWVELAVIGGPAGELTSDDFVVVGLEPGTELALRPVSTDGLRVVLIVDTSGSMRGEPIAVARQAAAEFVGLLPAGTEVAVVSAGAGAEVLQPLSTDRQASLDALAGLTGRGETAVHDAVITGLDLLGEPTADEERFVILLTDGSDTASSASLDEVTGALASAEVTFHGVSLETSEYDTSSITAMANAAEGGLVVPATDTAALTDAYARIASAVVGRYQLSFIAEAGAETAIGLVGGSDPVLLGFTSTVELNPVGPSPQSRSVIVPPTTMAPVVVPEPAPEVSPEPSGFDVGLALPLGLGLVALALLVLLVVVTWPVDESRVKTAPRPTTVSLEDDRPQRRSRSLGALPDIADLLLGRFVKAGRMNRLLERAGLPWRAGEYLVLVGAAAAITAMAGALLVGHWLGFLAGLFGPTLGRLYLLRRAELRKKAFQQQLHSSLQLLASNLRVGHALLGALDSVAEETSEPTSLEFKRVVGEVRLGRPLGEALQAMADRLESEDLRWVGEAVEIQRDVGGDLAEVLDNVAETLAERQRLEGHVAALAADGKMSSAVMMLLPFVVAVLMSLSQPDYLSVFIERSSGRILALVGIGLMTMGGVWLKKLTKLAF